MVDEYDLSSLQCCLSGAAPLDQWEADPAHLRDEQTAFIFLVCRPLTRSPR